MSATYVGVRDGKPALLKRCEDCGKEKVVGPDRKTSEFYVRWRPLANGEGSPGWGPTCIECDRRRKRERYAELTREERRRRAQEAWQRLLASPDRHAAVKLRRREWDAERLSSMSEEEREDWYQRRRESTRRWSDRKVEENPDYYRRELRRERSRKAKGGQVVDLTQGRVDPGPILGAIEGWLARNPENDYSLLSRRTGISERGIYRLVRGEHEHVTLDVADRIALAIGEPFSLLYPYEEAA